MVMKAPSEWSRTAVTGSAASVCSAAPGALSVSAGFSVAKATLLEMPHGQEEKANLLRTPGGISVSPSGVGPQDSFLQGSTGFPASALSHEHPDPPR